MSEAIERSNGNINFPFCKQEGFVWFTNRIYGMRRGKYLETARQNFWIKKGLIQIDNPTVNYLTAVSDKYFWVILSGESKQEESLTIRLDKVAELVGQGDIVQYTRKGRQQK